MQRTSSTLEYQRISEFLKYLLMHSRRISFCIENCVMRLWSVSRIPWCVYTLLKHLRKSWEKIEMVKLYAMLTDTEKGSLIFTSTDPGTQKEKKLNNSNLKIEESIFFFFFLHRLIREQNLLLHGHRKQDKKKKKKSDGWLYNIW